MLVGFVMRFQGHGLEFYTLEPVRAGLAILQYVMILCCSQDLLWFRV